MEFQIERAEQYYAQAMNMLPTADRKAAAAHGLVMAAIYRTLLEEIKNDGCLVLSQRTSLTPIRKLVDRLAHLDQGLKVAVIGGGWAGLTTAVELAAKGVDVTVFEAARQLGGRARSVEISRSAPRQRPAHPHWRLSRNAAPDGESGPKPGRTAAPASARIESSGRRLSPEVAAFTAPFNLALGLLRAKGLSLREKLSAARFMRSLQSTGYRLDNDCSVAALLDRHRQSGHLRRFMWEPLCIAALNTAPAHASAWIFANVLRDSLGGQQADTDLLLPHSDLSRIFRTPRSQFAREKRRSYPPFFPH